MPIILPPRVDLYIEKMPEWATSADGPRWAYLAKRFAEDRREWKQKARELEQRNAKLVKLLREIEQGKHSLPGVLVQIRRELGEGMTEETGWADAPNDDDYTEVGRLREWIDGLWGHGQISERLYRLIQSGEWPKEQGG